MKKILAVVLVVILALSICACGKEKDDIKNTTGDSVDQNTISLVNTAFGKTADSVSGAEALGVKMSYRCNLTKGEDGQSAFRSKDYKYIGTGADKQFLYEYGKSGDTEDSVAMYSDGKNIYGFKVDTTYLLVNDNNTNDYINNIHNNISILDTSNLEVVDTIILNTSSGGHAFVIKYKADDKGFDPTEAFKPLFDEDVLNIKTESVLETKPVSLSVSGTIDTEGRLIDETVTYEYSYEYEDNSQVDPDNPEAQGTIKTANVKLVAEGKFTYNQSSISAPSGMTLLPEVEVEGEEKPQIKELSLTDFLKLSQQSAN